MVELSSGSCVGIGGVIRKYEQREFLCITASLLTDPRYSANSIRIEVLIHLIVVYCTGKQKTTRSILQNVLNSSMRDAGITILEDPSEDVFVSTIFTQYGDLRIINGIWETPDYFVQALIDVGRRMTSNPAIESALENVISLLKLSEELARRSGLQRNAFEESISQTSISIANLSSLKSQSSRVVFTKEDFAELGVSIENLKPFIFDSKKADSERGATIGNSGLERRPIVAIDQVYVVALPSSLSIALRKYFLEVCLEENSIGEFEYKLGRYQGNQLARDILEEYRGVAQSVSYDMTHIDGLPNLQAVILREKTGIYQISIMVRASLLEILDKGFDGSSQPSRTAEKALNKLYEELTQYCEKQPDFREGRVLHLYGGLGRGYAASLESIPRSWNFLFIGISDLLQMSMSKASPLKELYFCLMQRNWAEDKGTSIFNIGGDLNYFGFWESNDFQCIQSDVKIGDGNMLALQSDFLFKVRQKMRSTSDVHSVIDCYDSNLLVTRFSFDSLYEEKRSLPIYVCMDHAKKGNFNALIECRFAHIWVGVVGDPKGIEFEAVYEWWAGFVDLLTEVFLIIDESIQCERLYRVQLTLDLSELELIGIKNTLDPTNRGEKVCLDGLQVTVKLESNYLSNFSQAENFGEKKLVGIMSEGIASCLEKQGIDVKPYLRKALDTVVHDPGVRIVHAFRTFNQTDYILHLDSGRPVFCDEKIVTFEKIKICYELGYTDELITGKQGCSTVLNTIVEMAWIKIRQRLHNLNKPSLLLQLCQLLNNVEQDRTHWSRTARSIRAIHGRKSDVESIAQKRESDRSLASMCTRALLEMASIESSNDSYMLVSKEDLTYLLSLCSVLISAASDSDAIHGELIAPELVLHANGVYELSRDIFAEVLMPYFYGHFRAQLSQDEDEYESLYETSETLDASKARLMGGSDFANAFQHEVGISRDVFFVIYHAIVDDLLKGKLIRGVKNVEQLVDEIRDRTSISVDEIRTFIDYFSLKSRAKWDKEPPGYANRDILPWKHKRRLSCLVKPILYVDEENVLIDLLLIKQGINYFFMKARDAEFHTQFFESNEMRSYIGSIVEKRGAEFTELVRATLDELGWDTEKEVQMTSLGAPPELGDIDVLAVKGGKVLIIECKRLQLAKTSSEIADICNRFKGQSKDELHKHTERVSWVKHNEQCLGSWTARESIFKIEHFLVTSTEMPMQYRNDLSIDASHIASLKKLASII